MLAAKTEPVAVRPCVLVAHADAGYAAVAARAFRRLGWDDYVAGTGPEVRRLARMLDAAVVVLDVDLAGESGWLTCDKLRRERPHTRVILVGRQPTPLEHRLAAFAGACGLVAQTDGVAALLAALDGTALPAAS